MSHDTAADHDNKTTRTHWREETSDKSERKRPALMETAVQHQHQRQSVRV